MARDADTIEREIEQARDALAATLDELATRPKRAVEAGSRGQEAPCGPAIHIRHTTKYN